MRAMPEERDVHTRANDPWRWLKDGQRVKLTQKYRRGQAGTIIAKLDDRIDGWARYAVRLDAFPDRVTDCTRQELAEAAR